ncbi:hypothetical protein [Kitasatospora sp. NRRL B-11411]|uniref:hypothetical protein n=1 Tax=Kitasatospora sp. NRRL B-11411 TaxID=1463822 RepID=UPI0004C301B3|nr:hypothetical protein [Kitasatospora sp. NRRL B-11411]
MSTAPLADTVSADAADRHGHRFLLIGQKTVSSSHLGLSYVPIRAFQPADLAPAATPTVPSLKDPHGAAPKSPPTPGTRCEGKTGDRPVPFTAGRQDRWNNTSLNKKA